MRIKYKILLIIIIILLFQMFLSAGFSIIMLNNLTQSGSINDIREAYHEARMAIELEKHKTLNYLYYFQSYFENTFLTTFSKNQARNILTEIKNASGVDWLIVMDEKNHILFNIKEKTESQVIHLLNNLTFRFPQNKFITSKFRNESISLLLVTGTTIHLKKGSIKIYLITDINNHFIDTLYQKTRFSLGFFKGENNICSNLPLAKLSKSATNIYRITHHSIPYMVMEGNISPDGPEYIRLAVFNSLIRENLYFEKLCTAFILAFGITLILSGLVAAGLTDRVIHNLTLLRKWLEDYTIRGNQRNLVITSHDEIGFFARAFHDMVHKLIQEEKIVRDQLSRISFLHQYNESIVSNVQAGLIVANSHGRIDYANPYFCSLIDRKQENIKANSIINLINSFFFISDKEKKQLTSGLQSGQFIGNILLKKDKNVSSFMVKMIPIVPEGTEKRTLIMLEDVTKIEQLWKKIMINDRISSLGMLSAGMAHELNNPLGSILSHVDFLLKIEKEKEKTESLTWIQSETRRISEIIRKVLSFSRANRQEKSSDINRIIMDTIDLIKIQLKKNNIRIASHIDTNLQKVSISPDKFKQVLLNILLNSRQAIVKNGKIEITTSKQNSSAVITIYDNGQGIKNEHMANIFDPFFTTKSVQNGTGLGLTIVYSIIKQAYGELAIQSTFGKGTKVIMELPFEKEGK